MTGTRPRVTLLVFAWNEIDGMRVIMPQIRREWCDQLIVVDGGSTDGTIEYCREHGLDYFVQSAPGAGVAFREAMERVTGDVAVVFSPDGNSVPEKIPELVAKLGEGYDMVICSRYLPGARSDDDDAVTAFGNRLFTGLVNLLFRARVTDMLVMYRAYDVKKLRALGVDTRTPCYGTQILLRAIRKGYRIGEIPGDEPARIGGERKMQPLKNGLLELLMIAREFLRRG